MKNKLTILLLLTFITCGGSATTGGGGNGGGTGTESEAVITGTLTINNGDSTTTSLQVTVKLIGTSTPNNIVSYILSEDSTTPESSAKGWVTVDPTKEPSIETTFNLSATVGEHTIYAWFKDDSGNLSSAISATITLESGSLSATITINNGSTHTNNRDVTLKLNGVSDVNITGYLIDTNDTAPASTSDEWNTIDGTTFSQEQSYTLTDGDAAKMLYFHLRDQLGTKTGSANITLDTIAPTGTIKIDNGTKLTLDADVDINLTGSDANGIIAYQYTTTNSQPSADDSNWVEISSTTDLTRTDSTTLEEPLTEAKTRYAWLKDSAGNVSGEMSDIIELPWTLIEANLSIGSYTSIAIDSNDEPKMTTYREDTESLSFYTATWNDLIYNNADDPADDSTVAIGTSIAIDSNDKIHIAYHDETNKKLKYANNVSGTWFTETIEDGGQVPSIVIDDNDIIHISHRDYTGRVSGSTDVRYVTGTQGAWSSELPFVGQTHTLTSIALASDNTIHIVTRNFNEGIEIMTKSNGSWSKELIPGTSAVDSFPNATVDSNDNVYISFRDSSDLGLLDNKNGTWTLTEIDETKPTNNNIAIDSQDKIHICYRDRDNNDLKYATNHSGEWLTYTLDSEGDVGNYCDIAIDSKDRLHISYYDATNKDLKYITTADQTQ